MTSPFVINLINLVLVLIAIILIYRVLVRTSGCLCKGSLYIFLALIVLAGTQAIHFISFLDKMPLISSQVTIGILGIVFILLLITGLWNWQKCIVMAADGKVTISKKAERKKK